MTTVYVAMVNDRHYDPAPYVFTTLDKAIEFARAEAARLADHGEEGQCTVREEPVDGWLFHAVFCVEGDNVWVIEKRIDQPDDQEAPDG